jgi:transposase-like protein
VTAITKPKTKDLRSRAHALVHAEIVGDAAACAELGKSQRTLRRWRRQVERDPELARAYAAALDGAWVAGAQRFFTAAARRGTELARDLPIEEFRALVAAVESIGSVLVTRERLMSRLRAAEEHDDGDELPGTRAGAADRADRAGTLRRDH